jgi:hypothetical protein
MRFEKRESLVARNFDQHRDRTLVLEKSNQSYCGTKRLNSLRLWA